MDSSRDDLIKALSLEPHPEGGWFAETYRHAPANGERGDVTAIYYLLPGGKRSTWHRVTDADESWHFYDGAPLILSQWTADGVVKECTLGRATDGHPSHAVVPRGVWQSARSLGDWSLVGCTVSPAFQFESFELAESNWEPPPQ